MNKFTGIIRAHEVQMDGYLMHTWKEKQFPLVITIFSAPNYCDIYNNKGSILKLKQNQINIQSFKSV